MCLMYGKPPRFVRACYRTGHRGEHVLIDDAHFKPNGCLMFLETKAGRSPRAPRHGATLHFQVQQALPAVVADMARYTHAEAYTTELNGRTYVTLVLPPHVGTRETQKRLHEAFADRAGSFGWVAVEWREGLPSQP